MNQHPVPQNVTQYQFRLVGDMTLKQFLELAAGLLLAVLFYSSNLIFIFKWPLILLSVFFGIALAFFPIEDRPLDQWIYNFFTSIYKPTRFIWKKTNKVPNIFTFTAHPIAATNAVTKTIKAPAQSSSKPLSTDLSQTEDSQIKSLNTLFDNTPTPSTNVSKAVDQDVLYEKPSVTVRKLSSPQKIDSTPLAKPPKAGSLEANQNSTNLKVDKLVSPAPSSSTTSVPNSLIFQSSTPTQATQATPQVTPTKTLSSISLPVAPRSPNLIVGVATSKDGKLVENAIVQVLDQTGLPARAMKTNTLGQFATSTPLSPGVYTIEVESDGHSFNPQQLTVNNTIIKPFEIRANS